MLGPLLHLPVQACLLRSGVPCDSPLEGHSMWYFASVALGCATRSFCFILLTKVLGTELNWWIHKQLPMWAAQVTVDRIPESTDALP